MDNDLARRCRLSALFGRGTGDERRPFLQSAEAIIGAADDAFGKHHQRPSGFDKNTDGGSQSLSIQAFPENAESADSPQQPALESALREQVPTGHCLDRSA